jgi:hypothetical protein
MLYRTLVARERLQKNRDDGEPKCEHQVNQVTTRFQANIKKAKAKAQIKESAKVETAVATTFKKKVTKMLVINKENVSGERT